MSDPRSQFATVKVTDSNITAGSPLYDSAHRSRLDYDRLKFLSDALRAYRLNPLARRIVKLYRQFAIGEGITVELVKPTPKIFSKNHTIATTNFIKTFWDHSINSLDDQIQEWFDERTLTGNLFILFSVDDSGMPLVRAIPTEDITAIDTRENDYRQELAYHTSASMDDKAYPAFDPAGPPQTYFVKHYTINRPVGSVWGESDLFPILPWIARYTGWLEGRASLNYYRSLFVWVLSGTFTSEEERKARQEELRSNPPQPNSILVKNENEEWSTLNPQLEAYEASADGLALKKAIAVGAGIPPHYLAEPESTTKTTAEAAGTPTFRNFQEYQSSFFQVIIDVLKTACKVRKISQANILAEPEFEIHGQDISERDNANLALAVNRAYGVFAELYDRKMITKEEFMRMTYEFAGEVFDESKLLPNEGLRKPLSEKNKTSSNPAAGAAKPADPTKSVPDTGTEDEEPA